MLACRKASFEGIQQLAAVRLWQYFVRCTIHQDQSTTVSYVKLSLKNKTLPLKHRRHRRHTHLYIYTWYLLYVLHLVVQQRCRDTLDIPPHHLPMHLPRRCTFVQNNSVRASAQPHRCCPIFFPTFSLCSVSVAARVRATTPVLSDIFFPLSVFVRFPWQQGV